MQSMMGRCIYCGAEIGVMAKSQEEANEIASKECNCAGGKTAQKKESMIEQIKQLTGLECEELGFSPVVPEVREIIERAGCEAIEGKLQQASFKVDGTTITIKAGEKTKVTRKYTYEQSGEVE